MSRPQSLSLDKPQLPNSQSLPSKADPEEKHGNLHFWMVAGIMCLAFSPLNHVLDAPNVQRIPRKGYFWNFCSYGSPCLFPIE